MEATTVERMLDELKKSLDDWFGDNGDEIQEMHFTNGWYMWPEYWHSSTYDWRAGFTARAKYEDRLSKESKK